MIERAEWRPRPGDPRSPIGTCFGRDRWMGLPVALWVAPYAAAVALFSSRILPDFGEAVFLVAFMPLLSEGKEQREPEARGPRRGLRQTLTLATTNPFALFVADTGEEVADLAPEPAPVPLYRVEITLRRGKRTTGGDLGVVAFSDGWLVYEGLGTAFTLRPSDVRRSWPGLPDLTLDLPEGQRLTLRSYGADWRGAFDGWLGSPSPDGRSRLPPLARSPLRRLRPAGTLHLAASVAVGFGVASIVDHSRVRGTVAFGVLALVLWLGGTLVAAWARRPVPRAKRDGMR